MEGGGGVGADSDWRGIQYVLSDINSYKGTLKNADWKPFLNSHKSRVTTSLQHYIFAFDNDFEKLLYQSVLLPENLRAHLQLSV